MPGTKEALDLDASGNPTYLNFTHVERSLEVSASYQDGNWSLAAEPVQTNLIDARFYAGDYDIPDAPDVIRLTFDGPILVIPTALQSSEQQY